MRDDLTATLGADPIDQTPGPPLTTMASVAIELPDGAHHLDVERTLLERGVEVPIVSHPGAPWPLVRISAHLYNRRSDAQRLSEALAAAGVRGKRIP